MWKKLAVACLLVAAISGQGVMKDANEVYQKMVNAVLKKAQDRAFVVDMEKMLQIDRQLPKNMHLGDFECPVNNASLVPMSVHNLRPANVKIIAAMGDSLTAGTGILAKNIFGLVNAWRGMSWSIGGDETVATVPTLANIIRKYNPNVKGFALGVCNRDDPEAGYNIARPGDKSINMPEQAVMLADKMKADTSVDFQNDWKVITLFIGGNDLCQFCNDKAAHSAAMYVQRIQEALDHLHANVPRAFVNLVQVLDVRMVTMLKQGLICPTIQLEFCPCVTQKTLPEVGQVINDYWEGLDSLVASGRYDTSDDFTVVIQPFFKYTSPPLTAKGKADLSYFAPDCFHFSEKGHAAAGLALWNNMIEPVGQKATAWHLGEQFECLPPDHPAFYTSKNSNAGNRRTPALAAAHSHKTLLVDSSDEYYKMVLDVVKKAEDSAFVADMEKMLQIDRQLPKNMHIGDFNCPVNNASVVPTSVHELRPANVKIIAAMGDSLTAGTGILAKNIFGLVKAWRGMSWSIGGDETVATVPTLANIIRKYNPDVKGFALGVCDRDDPEAGFNIARPGDKSINMPEQAVMLVNKMMADTSVDFQNDWKVITLFIGGNDLCQFCLDREKHSADNYVRRILEALDYLHAHVPRAFVNLVQVLDVRMATMLNQGLVCSTIHVGFCPCGAYGTDNTYKELTALLNDYWTGLDGLVGTGRYDTRDDFTVVLQPFFKYTTPPLTPEGKADLSYFAPDCFHFSEKGHAAAGLALWNNMIEPVGQKATAWHLGEEFECLHPDHPAFYTSKNSNRGDQRRVVAEDAGEPLPAKHNTVPSVLLPVGIAAGIAALLSMIVAVVLVKKLRHRRPHALA